MTDWIMVGNRARGMGATNSWTWVSTLVVHAGKGYGTLWIDGTFVLAFNVGVPLQTWETGARSRPVSFSTLGIYSAW